MPEVPHARADTTATRPPGRGRGLLPRVLPAARRQGLLGDLLATTDWRQESITLYGKPVALPRLTAWYGDEGTGYTYSGIVNTPRPWTPALLEVKRAVEGPSGVAFNSVLLNRYRSGRDSVAWHSDDEPEFGENPVIASVSLGGTRTFQFRHRTRKDLRASLELTHGSLLIKAAGDAAPLGPPDPRRRRRRCRSG